MNIELGTYETPHRKGESATHPIEPRCGTLTALLLLLFFDFTKPLCQPSQGLLQAISPECGVVHCAPGLRHLRDRDRRVERSCP